MLRFIFILCAVPVLLFSQVDDDWGDIDDVELVEDVVQTNESFSNYWDEHFYGSISGMYSQGARHSRRASELKLGFNDHWRTVKLVVEGSYRQNIVQTEYETFVDDALDDSGEVELGYDSFKFRQAYVEVYPLQNMTFSVGRHLTVWGQLEVFSPVDYLLPIDINPMGFSIVKADNRMPQTTVKLQYYPLSNLELTGYYFPFFEENELMKSFDFTDFYDNFNGQRYYTRKVVPSDKHEASTAFRTTWYASSFTAAVTYFDGFNNLFPVFKEKYIGTTPGGSHFFQQEYGYYKKRALGIELSVPFGQLSVKGEVSISDDFFNVDVGNSNDKLDIVNTYNHGYSSVPIYLAFYGVGIDANFDRWFCNFYLLGLHYFRNPEMNDFWSAYDARVQTPVKFNDVPILPVLNIGRYFNTEKKGAYGLALGYFTGALGAFIYISNQINESWSWGFSADIAASLSDVALMQSGSNQDGYTDYKFVEPKLTFGLGYKL